MIGDGDFNIAVAKFLRGYGSRVCAIRRRDIFRASVQAWALSLLEAVAMAAGGVGGQRKKGKGGNDEGQRSDGKG